MFIVLAVLAATALGAIVHAVAPARNTRGYLLSGAIAAAVSAVVYTVMTWVGVGEASIWTWLASILGAALVSAVVTFVLARSRTSHDAAEAIRLGIV